LVKQQERNRFFYAEHAEKQLLLTVVTLIFTGPKQQRFVLETVSANCHSSVVFPLEQKPRHVETIRERRLLYVR